MHRRPVGLGHEISRWPWMLYDYTLAFDPKLHERLEALADRFANIEPKGVGVAWEDLHDRRQLDACTGLLLARTDKLDPQPRAGFVDSMSTKAAGSFAWWCVWMLDTWEDEYPLGDRLRPDQIETFMGFARYLDTLLRLFPSIRQ